MGNSALLLPWIREDGPVEWLTVAGLLLCAFLCLGRATAPRRRRSAWFSWSAAVFGLAFLFGAGEEISWGQRLFGWQTPDWFAQHNRQAEINLHNLVLNDIDLAKLVFGHILTIGLVFYMSLVPFLYRRNGRFAGFVDRSAIPIARTRQMLVFLFLVAIIQIPEIRGRESELLEFAAVFLVFLVFLNPQNRATFNRVPDRLPKPG